MNKVLAVLKLYSKIKYLKLLIFNFATLQLQLATLQAQFATVYNYSIKLFLLSYSCITGVKLFYNSRATSSCYTTVIQLFYSYSILDRKAQTVDIYLYYNYSVKLEGEKPSY